MSSPAFDYYWRDYYGEIPGDAVPGGYDRNLQRTYIGQVFIVNHGLLPVTIYEGQCSVTASKQGIHTSDEFIKILCSKQPKKFYWIEATAANLHTETIGKHLVVGGTENGKILHIGRAAYQEEVIVGKVCGYDIESAYLYFPFENEEIHASSYQVLIFDWNIIIDDRDKFHSIPISTYVVRLDDNKEFIEMKTRTSLN